MSVLLKRLPNSTGERRRENRLLGVLAIAAKAELRRRIFEIDPLACPRCGHEMRIVAFITEPHVIDRILKHLRRSACADRRSRATPRRASRVRAAGVSV